MVPPEIYDMAVSFESREKKDAAAIARVLTPAMVESPKSEIYALRSLLIRMLALTKKKTHHGCASIQLKTATDPFQIPMDEVEAMHICQTLRNADELKASVKYPHSSSVARTSSIRFTSGSF